jgi:hypothetical protein
MSTVFSPRCPCSWRGLNAFHYWDEETVLESVLNLGNLSPTLRRFSGVDLGRAPAPDETTILNFRHLLERHDLCGAMLDAVNVYLAGRGIRTSVVPTRSAPRRVCLFDRSCNASSQVPLKTQQALFITGFQELVYERGRGSEPHAIAFLTSGNTLSRVRTMSARSGSGYAIQLHDPKDTA